MLGALSLKWNWRKRREAAGQPTDKPNLVFGGDVHVVWEKFCRYFDVEPRIVPLQPDEVHDRPRGRRAARRREHDRRGGGAGDDLHRPRRRHRRDQRAARVAQAATAASTSRCTSTRPAAASCGRSSTRTPRGTSASSRSARSTSPATSSGSSIPGIGWLIFREQADLAEDLVFYENYLGKTDATFTLNFSTGSAMVLAQYFNLIRFGHAGYRAVMQIMQDNTRLLATRLADTGPFEEIGADEEKLPLVAFRLAEERPFDEFDIAWQVAAERGWMLPAYTMPPKADHVKMLRALVKLNLSRALVEHARRRHRGGVRHAAAQGRRACVRAGEGEDQRRILTRRPGSDHAGRRTRPADETRRPWVRTSPQGASRPSSAPHARGPLREVQGKDGRNARRSAGTGPDRSLRRRVGPA